MKYYIFGVIVGIVILAAVIIEQSSHTANSVRPGDAHRHRTNANAPFAETLHRLVGKWQGLAYQNQRGDFQASPNRAALRQPGNSPRRIPVHEGATIELLVEIENQYLQIPGTESCWVTWTYTQVDGQRYTKREMFRIKNHETSTATAADAHQGSSTNSNAEGLSPKHPEPFAFTLKTTASELKAIVSPSGELEVSGQLELAGDQIDQFQIQVVLKTIL